MPDNNKVRTKQEEDIINEIRGQINQVQSVREAGSAPTAYAQSQVDRLLDPTDKDTPGVLKFKEVEREKEAERIKRLTKAMTAAGLTAASLGGANTAPTSIAAFRAALGSGTAKEILKEGAKYAGGKLLNFADHPYLKSIMTALSGNTAYNENPDDMGSIARAGVNALATRATGGLVGEEGVKKAGNFIVPPIMTILSEMAGQKMEGDRKIDPTSPGMLMSYAGALGQSGLGWYANHLKNAYKQTPGFLKPIKIQELEDLLGKGKISKEEFDTFSNMIRNKAGGTWAEMSAAGGFEQGKTYDFLKDNATTLAKIDNMPTSTPDERKAKETALMRVVESWNDKMETVRKDLQRRGDDFKSLDLAPDLNIRLNPQVKGQTAFNKSEPMDMVPIGNNRYDFVPRSSGQPTLASTGLGGPGTSVNFGRVDLPPMLRDDFVRGAIKEAQDAATTVGKTDALSWVSEVRRNPLAADAFKAVAENPKLQVGKWTQEESDFIKGLVKMPDARKFGEEMADPEKFRLFNKFFSDSPEVMKYGRQQYVSSLIDDITHFKSPKPGSDANIFTTFATRLKETNAKDFNNFFGNNDAYEAAKDIAFCLERAERYLAKRPTDFSTKEMMFASVFTTMTGAKLAGVSSESAPPVAFGAVGAAQMAIKAVTQAPQFVTKILEDYPRAAKVLRKYWENPQENGKYMRAFQQIVQGIMPQEPRPPEKKQQ